MDIVSKIAVFDIREPAKSTVAQTREQAERVADLGHAIAGAFQVLGRTLAGLYRITEEAYAMRELAEFGDNVLSARGLVRSDLPTVVTHGMSDHGIETAIRRFQAETARPSPSHHRDAA